MSDAITIERVDLGDAVCLRLAGVIDERFEAGPLFRDLPIHVVLELSGIKRITSFGVRQWSDAMKGLPGRVQHLYVLRAPACFIDQLNMVLNFGGRAEVVTATTLYFCDKCEEERAMPIDVLGDYALLSSGAAPQAPCPTCGQPMALEDDPQQAFRYVKTYGAKTIDADVVVLLEREGLYSPRKIGPPPEEMKLIHGDVTLLVLSGTLDQRFRPRRLAAGVEGQVVLDVGGVLGADATGLERFRQLLSSLEEAGTVTLVDVPETLLRDIAGGGLPLGRAQLESALLTFECASCGSHQRASIQRADGPTHRPACERCGEPTLLAGAGPWLDRAFAGTPAALPASTADVIKQRAELISRARAESGVRDTGAGGAAGALGRYRVLRPLSRGGMAEILLAVHEGIGGFEKLIALKKIRRKLLERRHVAVELFLNEAKIVANLNHPNIVQTFEVGEHGGDLFIAMEYVHGVDARTVIKRRVEREKKNEKGPQLSIEQILYVGTQVAAALHHAHEAHDLSGRALHIVHRDVSLSNIVIGFDGQVKLVDFGIATAASVVAKDGLIGKFSYMSPEQVAKEPLDGRSDVFSLGIVLFELIAGRPLFRRDTDEETLRAVNEDPVPSLEAFGVTPDVQEVLLGALARDRDQRYADARAFELALQGALQRMGGMSAHQLSMRMRELFPVESAAAPTASQPVDLTASPTNDSNVSRSRSFFAKSQTFNVIAEGETADYIDVSNERPATVVAETAERKDATPVVARADVAAPTPPSVVVDTPRAAAVEAPPPVTPKRAGEGVHFNRVVRANVHGPAFQPSDNPAPYIPPPQPQGLGAGRMIVIALALLVGILAVVAIFLRG